MSPGGSTRMSEHAQQSAERLRKLVPILKILANYGYRVREDGGLREQQFSCDLHGDGQDQRPSARVYPESNSWYCWACDRTRDVIQTVQEKEGLTFWPTVRLLERQAGLSPLEAHYSGIKAKNIVNEVTEALNPLRTLDDDIQMVRRFLDSITHDRTLPLDTLLQFWSAFDQIIFMVQGPYHDGGGEWSPDKGRRLLLALLDRVKLAEQECLHESPPSVSH